MISSGKSLGELLSSDVFKETMDILEEGVLIVDRNCNILYYNKTLAHQEELDSLHVIGKSVFEVFPSLKPEESTVYQVIRSGRPSDEISQQYINYKGKMIRTKNTTVPLFEDGVVVGAVEVSRDISLIVNLTEKLVNLQHPQSMKNKNKKAHGLRFSFEDIIGEDQKIKDIIAMLRKVAKTTSSVLIYGETGAGKELFAQSIHNEGPRRNYPFIAQNCAALPETILEGLLFGTTRGSFTGAVDKPGLFEQADGGTMLLDEVNSMSTSLQAKILRVLQEGFVRRLGGNEDVPVNVKIIATTNEKPSDLLRQGKLREDLYYRLSVIYVEIPSLRDRVGDIELLVKHFIDKYNEKFGKRVSGIYPSLLRVFEQYHWPGNVRELEHVIEALMNFADEGEICQEHLQFLGFGAFKKFVELRCFAPYLKCGVDEYEKMMILKTLQETGGNIARAAKKMGIKRQALQYRLKKYNINKSY